jgi:hypothetical protein
MKRPDPVALKKTDVVATKKPAAPKERRAFQG